MKPLLLLLTRMSAQSRAALAERFEIADAPDGENRTAVIAAQGEAVRIVLTNGTIGLTAAEIDAMPRLTLACALGAGYENMAVDHARARGIVLANGAGTNDDSVADHAFALLLGAVRGLLPQDRACRAGIWRDRLPVRSGASHRRLGLLGLGAIGRKIAQRGLGFEMAIGYHQRRVDAAQAHRYFDSPVALAQWCDFLVVATPGGPSTHHLVDAAVLAALGPDGFLVNISRGSVVDTAALAAALQEQRIAGAALDVYEGEPAPPAALLGFEQVLLTPHVAGASPEALKATLSNFLVNAELHLAGQPVRTPI